MISTYFNVTFSFSFTFLGLGPRPRPQSGGEPGPGRAPCQLRSNMILTYFNVSFSFFLHSWPLDPGLGRKAAAGRAWAGPLAAASGPGPGSRAQECEKNEKDTLTYNMKYNKSN